MKTITIAETASGFLIVTGDMSTMEKPKELLLRSHAFNNLDKCMGHIRKTIKAWDCYAQNKTPKS